MSESKAAAVMRAAADELTRRVDSAPPEARTSGIPYGVWLKHPTAPGAFHMTTTPAREKALAQLFAAVAAEYESGDWTVESDVLPTWLDCELSNVAATLRLPSPTQQADR